MPPADAWSCAACGFPSRPDDAQCFVCHKPRPESGPATNAGKASTHAPVEASSGLLRFAIALATGLLAAGLGLAVWALVPQGSQQVLTAAGDGPSQVEQLSTPLPDPSDASGTYTVRTGDSLYSIAVRFGVTEQELDYWNVGKYPTLLHQPRQIMVGWVLVTEGPPLPTPVPRPTRAPTPAPLPTAAPPIPTIADVVSRYLSGVPITYYEVFGSTPSQLSASMDANGPWSDWLQRRTAGLTTTEIHAGIVFVSSSYGTCLVETTSVPAITYTFVVTLPHWSPSAGASSSTVNWWTTELEDTARHEAHHVELNNNSLPALNDAVSTNGCSTLDAALKTIFAETHRQNCIFDLEEYGYALGLTLDSCLAA
jgi:predicted secreted Zn-dependent protease